nr:uncharacterized protein LOC113828820 [Penaeus vannamei]
MKASIKRTKLDQDAKISVRLRKQERVHCSEAPLAKCQGDQEDFSDRLITQDETRVHHHDSETKTESKQRRLFDSPPPPPSPRKAWNTSSASKVMLTVFWNRHGGVMMDFLAKGTAITGTYYASLSQKLREAIKTKRRGMLTRGTQLLQDNAPVHDCSPTEICIFMHVEF